MKRSEKGFSIVELALVLVIVGIIGFVGVRVWQANNTPTPQVSNETPKPTTQLQAPAITKITDLTNASTSLDATDVGESDITTLDSQLSF